MLRSGWFYEFCGRRWGRWRFIAVIFSMFFLTLCPVRAEENRAKAISFYNLGLAAYKQGATDRAVTLFKRAVDFCPDLKDAQYNLGMIFMMQGRTSLAIAHFQEVLKCDTGDQGANLNIAKCFEKSGQPDKAKWHYAQIKSNYHGYTLARSRLDVLSLSRERRSEPQVVANPVNNRTASPLFSADICLAGRSVFTLLSSSEDQSRAENVQKYLNNALVASQVRGPSAVAIVYTKGRPVITIGGYQVVTVDAENAQYAGISAAALAQLWANSLKEALRDEAGIGIYVSQLTGRALPVVKSESSKVDIPWSSEEIPKVVSGPVIVQSKAHAQSAIEYSVADKPIRDKWAVIIGISKFANPSYNLQFAAKDASDFRDYLVKSGNFRADHVLTLIDEQATRANIMRAFGSKWLPILVEPGDMAVVYISTHGTPAAQDSGGRNYIVAYDTDANDLYASGVDMDELARRIKEIKTDRALIVLDTCYSGGSIPGSRGLVRVDSFDASKLECGRGHLIISASSPNERSWESTTVANGVFTKHLIDSLKQNPNASVKQAFENCAKQVEWEVKLTRTSTQTPQLGGDWQGSPLVLSAPATEPRPMIPSMLAEFGNAPVPSNTKSGK